MRPSARRKLALTCHLPIIVALVLFIKPCRNSLSEVGDGSVTYESLSYPNWHWKEDIPELEVKEILHAEHRDTVASEQLFEVLVPHIATKSHTTDTS